MIFWKYEFCHLRGGKNVSSDDILMVSVGTDCPNPCGREHCATSSRHLSIILQVFIHRLVCAEFGLNTTSRAAFVFRFVYPNDGSEPSKADILRIYTCNNVLAHQIISTWFCRTTTNLWGMMHHIATLKSYRCRQGSIVGALFQLIIYHYSDDEGRLDTRRTLKLGLRLNIWLIMAPRYERFLPHPTKERHSLHTLLSSIILRALLILSLSTMKSTP